MKIITLTLNPAFDMHCHVDDFKPFHENLASITAWEAGGKGVNISRALTACGVENTALVVLGDENGETFEKALAADSLEYRSIVTHGRIRENITLHTNTNPETRISFAGFTASDDLLSSVRKELYALDVSDAIITVTGRNPSGVTMNGMLALIAELKERGAKIVIDSRSFGKNDLIAAEPWLIKPNEEEIGSYTDVDVKDFASAKSAAEALRARGIENVMISLGSRGALLVCEDGCFVAHAPKIRALSTIGAGDSSIGGFCAAAAEGQGYDQMLKRAVCYGSAACMTEGTRPPKREDVERLVGEVTIERF